MIKLLNYFTKFNSQIEEKESKAEVKKFLLGLREISMLFVFYSF